MYVSTREGLGRGLIPSPGGLTSSYIGEAEPAAKVECPRRYEKGEVEKSRCQKGPCQQGHLPADVVPHLRGLLIADFGVGQSGIKETTKNEKALQDWLRAAKSDLYSIFLRIYGYTDCVGADEKNLALRRERAKQVYALLDKDLQSRVTFVGPARPGEYVADNKTIEGRAKNRGVIIELYRLPEQVIEIKGRAPRIPCSGPSCKPPIPPSQKLPQQRDWKIVGQYKWQSKKNEKKLGSYLLFYGRLDLQVTGSVNATDKELTTFKIKWEKEKGLGGELERKISQWFDVKIEVTKKGLKVAIKKDVKLYGETLVAVPHLQLSTELVKVEVKFDVLPPFLTKIIGQDVKIVAKPQLVGVLKVDFVQLLKDRLKDNTKDILRTLLENLIKHLGKGLIGALGGKLLAGLLGGVLRALFLSSPPTSPVTAPPDDVNGKDRALSLVGTNPAAVAILQSWANMHRHAFAKAFADTMVELCRERWKDRLAELRSRSLNGYKALPAPSASDNEWVRWASTQKALQTVSIELPTDAFASRFRWYELMVMFALAAWLLRRITKDELERAQAIALRQASAAGIAAAVQYVRRRIAADTFDFIDEHGKQQQASGTEHWDTITKLVRSSQLSDKEISRRLERLGVEQLPSLPRTA